MVASWVKVPDVEQAEIVARLSILDLLARYTSIVDSKTDDRLDRLRALFSPDAELEIVGHHEPMVGHAALHAHWTAMAEKKKTEKVTYQRHLLGSTVIDVHGETAGSSTYFAVFTDIGLDHWGRYHDELGLCDGEWLLTRRRTFIDGVAEGGMGDALRL
jgi:hypothetical protein